ncbi:MAG: DNA polymerase III subunit alpha [Dehalococcoidia bacterium]
MFTHLHLHTEYSLLDGLARIPQVMDRVQAMGQTAVGITDHGVMYGVLEFYKAAKNRGIKPILGMEGYVAPHSRLSRDPKDKSPYHLTLLAQNLAGYRNLIALSSRAHLEGYYYKPRMDRELLEQYREGIIVLSGCPSSEIHRALQQDRWDDAREAVAWFRERFPLFHLEIQEHGDPQFSRINPMLIQLSRETGVPIVCTNDSHYTAPEDAEPHDILLCIGTNSTVNDAKRMKMEGGSYYVKSEAEMRALFPELPEAFDNTWKIAEQCGIDLEFGRLQLPDPDLPPGVTSDEHLANLTFEGLHRRYPLITDEIQDRARYELEVVRQTGFSAYILIVRDFAVTARARGIPFGVRGSAAASIILYCTGITDIDPMANRLVFERFLHVEQHEMPDVDMDFADDRREEMIRYTAEKYGADRVAQIITFGTLGAKAALRDVGRALGMAYSDVDRVTRLVPNALHMTLDRALSESNELKGVYEGESRVRELVDMAKKVEGIARHASTHAAGVVIARDPLIENVPLQRPARGEDEALPMVQFDMNTVAEIGLLKMDFLGLSNLTILGRAVDMINASRGADEPSLDLLEIPDGDELTYAMLSRGETFGVFQLESAPMRRALLELKPNTVSELAALVALYRPGPMQHISTYCRAKHGLEPIHYPHPDLAEILDETYGVIVYQDQVLLIARKFAGYSLGQADIMRKAMGKKIAEKMKGERENFVRGSAAKGYREEDANAIFDLIEPFAGYAFNKAHSVCYGSIAYQTAFLKSNFPIEYMTAVLMLAENHPTGMAERVAQAVSVCLHEMAQFGIQILGPDVNRSETSFSRVPGEPIILFGLATVKNVGYGVAETVLAARAEGGKFASIEDFCRRVSFKNLNKRVLESLVKAGAFDSLVEDRGTLLANIDRILSLAQREQKLRDSNQASMFDLFGQNVPTPMPSLELEPLQTPIPLSEQLNWEKELLGVYVSEHPFRAAAATLHGYTSVMISEVNAELGTRELALAGMVTSVRPLLTKDGRAFCAAEIEDLSGSIEVTIWSDVYEATKDLWEPGAILLLVVKLRPRDDRLNVAVQRATRYTQETEAAVLAACGAESVSETAERKPSNGNGWSGRPKNGERPAVPSKSSVHLPLLVQFDLRETADEVADRRRLRDLVALLQKCPGEDETRLIVHTKTDEVDLALPGINLTESLETRLKGILGDCGSLSVVARAPVRSDLGAA